MTPERWAQIREALYAVLDLEPDQRPDYLDRACTNDPTLRQEVESYILSHAEVDIEFLKTIVVGDANSERVDPRHSLVGRLIGPYRIVDEIGSGGMGEVYRAVRADDQYQKQVAIKVVRRGFDTDSGLRRFKAERQILASLDHPNIARLLDSGSTEDGLPYVVMELVGGKPIDEYCEGHNLSLVERLQLFRTVCATVHYAHQHLVVHRDLKPGNILVTEEGAPKLLDFGIAKLLAPEVFAQPVERTATLMRVMTPEFASPEQVRGETITTASDVYSLGVVLYRLLTGCSPYKMSSEAPHDIAREICESDPQKPSVAVTCVAETDSGHAASVAMPSRVPPSPQETQRLRRHLAGDLDNIVLMALRKEPLRRYASAAQLSDDIRRHLEGLPVVARKDTIGYRAGKFVTRHKLGVTAAVLVFVLLLAGMAAIVREARIAEANGRRAEKRFNDVRKLANSLLSDIYDSVRDLPGSTPSRKLIVDGALQYLDSLAQESAGDQSLQRELADAYEKVGRVQGGDPGQPNLGDTAGALSSFQKMLTVRQALAKANPNGVDDQIALARSYRAISDLQVAYLGDVRAGLENCTQAVAIAEAMSQAHPNDSNVTSELAADYEKLGDIQGGGNGSAANLADVQAGLRNHTKALALVRELAAQAPANRHLQRNLAVSDYKIQNDLIQTGDRGAALLRAQEAIEIFERLAKQDNNASAQRDLAVGYFSFAALSQADGRFADALQYFRKEAQLLEPVVAADPKNVDYRTDLASAHASIGYTLCRTGYPREGLAGLRQALSEINDLYQSNRNSQIQATVGSIQIEFGDALERNGQLDEALKSYLSGQAIYQTIFSADPADVNSRSTLAGIQNQMAGAYLKLGNLEKASRQYREALTISEPMASGTVENLQMSYSVYESYSGLGDVSVAQAKTAHSSDQRIQYWNQARTWYQKGLDASKRIPNKASVGPDGFESPDPQVVAMHLAQCDRALAAERNPVKK
jgi:eukaryotic-like serine/threonine-protein kinase